MKAVWEGERQHADDQKSAELAQLRKLAMANEVRREVKMEYKAKKAKLVQRVENEVEGASIAKERVQAEKDDRIKDLQLSLQQTRDHQQQEPGRQQQQAPYYQQHLYQQYPYQQQQFYQQGPYQQHQLGQQGPYQQQLFNQQDPYQQQLSHQQAPP